MNAVNPMNPFLRYLINAVGRTMLNVKSQYFTNYPNTWSLPTNKPILSGYFLKGKTVPVGDALNLDGALRDVRIRDDSYSNILALTESRKHYWEMID